MKKSFRLGLSLVAATVLFSSVGSAITVFSESFATPPPAGLGVTNGTVTPVGWTIVSGSVDVLDNSFVNCAAPSGNNCIDINGSSGTAGLLRSGVFSLYTGNTYTFSFYVDGSQRNFGGSGPGQQNTVTWRVTDGTNTFGTGTVTRDWNAGWTTVSSALAGIGQRYDNVRIEFDGGTDTDNVGLLLDDVNLDCSGNNCAGQLDAPEPASIALLGTGLVLIGLRMRRR